MVVYPLFLGTYSIRRLKMEDLRPRKPFESQVKVPSNRGVGGIFWSLFAGSITSTKTLKVTKIITLNINYGPTPRCSSQIAVITGYDVEKELTISNLFPALTDMLSVTFIGWMNWVQEDILPPPHQSVRNWRNRNSINYISYFFLSKIMNVINNQIPKLFFFIVSLYWKKTNRFLRQ